MRSSLRRSTCSHASVSNLSEYSYFDRLLHHIALGSKAVRATSFDLERSFARINADRSVNEPHVFVTGLARAGTSLLLQMLHDSGRYATQSYRDMPFPLAPGLWRRLSGRHQRLSFLQERAHSDGVEVGFDSVEAFEEVFWLTFAGKEYVRADRLLYHSPDAHVLSEFRDYVAAVLAAHGTGARTRYLSKNNNNLLRLKGLQKAFPNCHVIIPFRDPLQQAMSLLRQHELFCELQDKDKFVRSYMGWLGHHEFGLDNRPFAFAETLLDAGETDAHILDQWLGNWIRVYANLLENAPETVIFWDYDAFCLAPHEWLNRLAVRVDLDFEFTVKKVAHIRPARTHFPQGQSHGEVLERARQIHERLSQCANARLGV